MVGDFQGTYMITIIHTHKMGKNALHKKNKWPLKTTIPQDPGMIYLPTFG